uniref:Addiction module component n=1 Tax=Candidatus Kentrum sp. FW TaxID=2126338 RepID=A0A450SU66_9GAMM|nr:MAG: hypothetical protein BECKFW1821A_GA0114235_107211 [Candidatus Kentron sp. FW]VFJ62834.1 MAG: hypothetical protein BECKFW1821B_GA0114236_107711 [Candidatus Kentron sp. FW]
MQAVKQEALDTISALPDDTDLDEIMHRLYVLDRIHKGQEAIERGDIISGEELEREIQSW